MRFVLKLPAQEHSMTRWITLLFAVFLCAAGNAVAALDLRLTPVVAGLERPVFLTHAGDGSGRLFVIEQPGQIRVIRDGVLLPTPFLDIRTQVSSGESEQGLLGLAFAPDYASSGRFYVNYTDVGGNTAIARFRVSADPDRADRATQELMLSFAQPFANHNGGWLGFGPDGFLYVASGDGGNANDTQGNAQNLGTLLGKILRLDVSGSSATAAAGNPFAGSAGARPEIWAYGLRNPWRVSFDRSGGDLWIADVGQQRTEEVNLQPAATAGLNYGWRNMEGSTCRVAGCEVIGVLPVTEYGRDQGCSITGGYVYRGSAYPDMAGRYIFGDFCSGRIWSLTRSGSGSGAANFTRNLELLSGLAISSFGEDQAGNLYVVSYAGEILALSDGPAVTGPTIDGNFTGSWYDPAQAGHGFFVEVLPGNLFLAWWFTFSPSGEQSWFGGAGPIVGNRVTLNPVRTTGGRFIPNFNVANIQNQPFGTMTFTFSSCSQGRVEFNFPDGYGQGVMELTRLTVPESLDCGR
jgi:glucose/arabinose dehydrogenase